MTKFTTLAEFAQTPNGQEFIDLRPDASLLAEIAERDRAATAGRHPQQPPKSETIFELTKRAVEERAACFTDEAATIWTGSGLTIRVYRSQELLILDASNGDPTQAERIRCGFLNPLSGWRFDLSKRDYDNWARKARGLAS